MKKIRLSKRVMTSHALRFSENWVANGHWAIRKDSICNPFAFASEDSIKTYIDCMSLSKIDTFSYIEDSRIQAVIPIGEMKKLLLTPWVKTSIADDDACVFGNGECHVLINRNFVKTFRIEIVYFVDMFQPVVVLDEQSEVNFVVMPFRENVGDQLLPSFISDDLGKP